MTFAFVAQGHCHLVLILLLLSTHCLGSARNTGTRQASSPPTNDGHWVDIWTAMPQLTEPGNLPPPPFNSNGAVFVDSTVRQTIRGTLQAEWIRVRISNAFGATDLPITAMSVALPSNDSAGVSTIQPETLKDVVFSGSHSIVVPNGALAVSDPINLPLRRGAMLSISTYLAAGQRGSAITSHPGSRTTSWMAHGNHVLTDGLTSSSTASVAHWYYISAVEAWVAEDLGALAIVGDSITDGRGSETDRNNRWPDLLSDRIHANTLASSVAICNQAAGGNRILADGLGPNAQGRIERDVLAQSGIRYAMVFEGVNDIGTAPATSSDQQVLYSRLVLAYKQMATRIHAFGIPVFAATITPFGAPSSAIQPYSEPAREETRQRINDWIRTSGAFDAVIDFDAILRSPQNGSMLDKRYDSGDFLHPNVAGYQALADAFPIELFEKFKGGVVGFT